MAVDRPTDKDCTGESPGELRLRMEEGEGRQGSHVAKDSSPGPGVPRPVCCQSGPCLSRTTSVVGGAPRRLSCRPAVTGIRAEPLGPGQLCSPGCGVGPDGGGSMGAGGVGDS